MPKSVIKKDLKQVLRTSHKIKQINFLIIALALLILASLALINYTDIDVRIQNHFFDFESKSWLIDAHEPIKKFFFYLLPKIIFGIAVLCCLTGSILGFTKKSQFFFANRHRFLLIFLGLSLIPLIAGNVKKITNVYCPTQLEIYGGNYPYVKIFDHYPAEFHQPKRAACFPAGHAVTGFALFILFFVFQKKSHRALGLLSGFILGWITALYQMLKGAHFFGDSLISMLLCLLLAALIAQIYLRKILKYEQQDHKKADTWTTASF